MPSFRNSKFRQAYTKVAGTEPVPGYVLIEPLGRGGFGEVWKCEGPGGLIKAIKFVPGNPRSPDSPTDEVRNEYQGFQLVKGIRHAYLLSVERLDLIGTELVIVMELADLHLGDRFHQCVADGLPGIPREELIHYLMEAAEALDLFGVKHGLQHLDVKPANLFLTSGHLQVGDFGLVVKIEGVKYARGNRGFTPEYAAPEVIQGRIHARSDQFSLALVYYELLTGAFPFSGGNPGQIAEQIVTAAPDLSRLPERDRSAVGRALSRQPEERFHSCSAFIRALTAVQSGTGGSSSRLSLVTPSTKKPLVAALPAVDSIAASASTQQALTTRVAPSNALPEVQAASLRSRAGQAHALLESAQGASSISSAETMSGGITPPPAIPASGSRHDPFPFRLEYVRSIFTVEYLLGRPSTDPRCTAEELVRTVVTTAQGGLTPLFKLGRVLTQADGSVTCKFLTHIDPRVAQVKLNVLVDEPSVTIESPSPTRAVIRRAYHAPVKSGLFGTTMQETNAGLEIEVQLPETGRGVAEVLATGRLYGNPSPDFAETARATITKMIQEIRRQLNTIEERRKDTRFAANFPVTIYPIRSDGTIDPALHGRCQDVSEGGLLFQLPTKPTPRHAYATFPGIPSVEGLAVLLQIVRAEERGDHCLLAGRYRLDFGPEGTAN